MRPITLSRDVVEAVAHLEGVVGVVGDEDDPEAALAGFADGLTVMDRSQRLTGSNFL